MKRLSPFFVVAATTGIAGALTVFGSPAASAATSGQITGLDGKCVDVAAASTANGTPVQMYDCNGTGAQNWTVGNSDNSIRALGKCMDVTSGSTASGAKVQLYDCNGTGAQQWTVSNGQIINAASGKCLDATGMSSANGNQLQIWTCQPGSPANQQWKVAGGTSPTPPLDTTVAPGGNFNMSVWELQEPVGSPGSPTTISSARLQGAKGYEDRYFYTSPGDGAMTFWAPEKGVTTPNSNFARSELRETNTDGSTANWALSGTHRMSATLKVESVTSNVVVGQIHLGTGGSSTKPLLELYYHSNGDIYLGTENSPSGGQTLHMVGHVPVDATWNYTIGVSGGNTIDLTVNGSTTHYAIPSSFDVYKQYFKAGSYNQSSSDSTTNGARVAFDKLTVSHS